MEVKTRELDVYLDAQDIIELIESKKPDIKVRTINQIDSGCFESENKILVVIETK